MGQEEEYPSKKTNPWKYLSQTKNQQQQQQKQKKRETLKIVFELCGILTNDQTYVS